MGSRSRKAKVAPQGALENVPQGALENAAQGALENVPQGALENAAQGALGHVPQGALKYAPQGAAPGQKGRLETTLQGALGNAPRKTQANASQEGVPQVAPDGPADGLQVRSGVASQLPAGHHERRPRWAEIDTILLDMDGTLLDLEFDNHFWLELIPQRYALHHALTLEAARAVLRPLFAARQGTLDWYCTDFWSHELGFDVAALKREAGGRVRFLPGAEHFLRRLAQQRLCKVLVTNAHRDSLSVKAQQTGLIQYFDKVVSSHDLGMPKEAEAFWPRLQALLGFSPGRCLFVDDSPGVLLAARRHGIGQIFAISRPDSTQAPRKVDAFAAVETVEQLLDSLPVVCP